MSAYLDIMSGKLKKIDPLPQEFASYEEAAEFWDKHDITDCQDSFETVAVEVELKRRRFEVMGEDSFRGVAPSCIAAGTDS